MPAPNSTATIEQDDEYGAQDDNDPAFYIHARVTSDNRLVFTIRTKIYSGGALTRTSSVDPVGFFDAMMQHFQDRGTLITRIKGEWSNYPTGLDSNLVMFNRSIDQGESKELAASKTFTGRMAAKWGYRRVDIVKVLPPAAVNNFTDVLVYFEQ